MTEVIGSFCCTMLNEEEGDESPTQCRERRRRRRAMRRIAVDYGSAGSSGSTESPKCTDVGAGSFDNRAEGKRVCTLASRNPSFSSGEGTEPATAPVFGTVSVSGRSRDMEDAICVRTDLCRPEISRRRPVHFFAVYDGHGGAHVAALCRERMHVLMEEELKLVGVTAKSESGFDFGSGTLKGEHKLPEEATEEGCWRVMMRRCFERMDEVALNTCPCGSVGYQCRCQPMDAAFTGSTAVVVVVTTDHIVVANCGDSRAVLCRRGRAVPLSRDHKPDRPDERARIEAFGGRVIFLNGARVEGILNMSRAVGDRYLKPIVTSEPEITFTKREADDDCLILASDGLWDVMSNELACEVVSECLREGTPPSVEPPTDDEGAARALYPSRSASAAALLTRLALGRRSADNISVIVVDLKRSCEDKFKL